MLSCSNRAGTSCQCRGGQWPFESRSLLALGLVGEFLSFPFPDGDPNEEDICGWSVREHYCGGCETVFRAVWEGKSL